MRSKNIYANRAAPSRDIARNFAVLEHLRFLCAGGVTTQSQRLYRLCFECVVVIGCDHGCLVFFRRAGTGLIQLFLSDAVHHFVNGATSKQLHPHKVMYQPGVLRKVYMHALRLYPPTFLLHVFSDQAHKKPTTLQMEEVVSNEDTVIYLLCSAYAFPKVFSCQIVLPRTVP